MIVPMKKITLAIMDRERDATLEKLGELGLVHFERKSIQSPRLQALLEEKERLLSALAVLEQNAEELSATELKENKGPKTDALVQEVLHLKDELKALAEKEKAIYGELNRLAGWGNFSQSDFAEFLKAGVELVPYEISLREMKALQNDKKILIVSKSKTQVRLFSVGNPFEIDPKIEGASPFAYGEKRPEELQKELDALLARQREIEGLLGERAAYVSLLQSHLGRLNDDIEYFTAHASFENLEAANTNSVGATNFVGEVSWIQGYVPDESVGHIKRAALEESWALLVAEPSESDAVPTKLKNNLFGRLSKPVFALLGTVPGYREYDISVSFLAFFTLFFAMIFGDAGYGSLLLLAIGFIVIKKRPKNKEAREGFLLLAFLSLATIIWGAINGSWFGLELETLPVFLQKLVIPPFLPKANMDPTMANKLVQQNIKYLCFFIGVVQLVFAHLKNIKNLFPSLKMFSEIGWLSLVIGLFYLVLNLVLDREAFPIPAFALYMIVGGLLVYFIFVEQDGGNFFANVGKGFAGFLPSFLSAVSSFSDIISYIRLFAVGLAGLSIAQSFNAMAFALPPGLVRILAGGLIFIFGHGLNIAMNALSVMVHGVRLNMLEYSGHLGMEWSGTAYRPFGEKASK